MSAKFFLLAPGIEAQLESAIWKVIAREAQDDQAAASHVGFSRAS
jgi:hypothetical protein